MSSDPADLSNLRDLALPEPVSWWPLQPGWWVVAAGSMALASLGGFWLLRRYRANAYRRVALRRLQNTPASGIAELLKRTALAAYPRLSVAGLTGDAWAAFLLRTGQFSQTSKMAQAALDPSRPLDSGEEQTIRTEAKRWIRRHRLGA